MVGSSSSTMGACCASAIAIQARCRSPPDSAATSRAASGSRPVAASASSIASRSARASPRSQPPCA
ncbi:conserved hypothetical protein [Burkholderia pseudomallei 1710b]|uniref:Uncharacterized protein n=1 Tax=Burkholderia pseudomallei (strain 1710b) TaxID=320372 RepID=Q3JSH8_BURP1|nr:conserved hypothetical protein [Burkholderia pseudomallei 1710b]